MGNQELLVVEARPKKHVVGAFRRSSPGGFKREWKMINAGYGDLKSGRCDLVTLKGQKSKGPPKECDVTCNKEFDHGEICEENLDWLNRSIIGESLKPVNM